MLQRIDVARASAISFNLYFAPPARVYLARDTIIRHVRAFAGFQASEYFHRRLSDPVK